MNRKQKHKIIFRALGLLSLVCCLWSLSGCIRLSGSAGFWHQGKENEAPKAKSVGFDTASLNPNDAPGDIQTN